VKRLIDPAVVIVAVIVPALSPQRFQKSLHPSRPYLRHARERAAVRSGYGDSMNP